MIIREPVYENSYAAGGSLIINARLHSDLIITGGNITINATNDILVAGGTLIMNGFAGGYVRCVGGNIHITKNVQGDVVIAGVNVKKHNAARGSSC